MQGKLLKDIVDSYIQGLEPDEIARRLGTNRARVVEEIEATESVLLLMAHDLPEAVMPRAARLSPDKVRSCVDKISRHFATTEEVRNFVAARIEVLTAPRPSPTQPAKPPELTGTSKEATQALAVLDFWASKWL